MKEAIIGKSINNIKNLNKYNDTQIMEIKYGLETLYLTLTKLFVIAILCIIFNAAKELLLFIMAFGLIKLTSFGLHAKKSWQCWVTSIPIFVGIPIIIKNLIIPIKILYIFLPLLLLVICLYAPADTEKRPLISKKKRIVYKVTSIITTTIYLLIIVLINNPYLNSILFYSLVLESLLINPLSYKLFGLRYNNYLSYNMKGGTK